MVWVATLQPLWKLQDVIWKEQLSGSRTCAPWIVEGDASFKHLAGLVSSSNAIGQVSVAAGATDVSLPANAHGFLSSLTSSMTMAWNAEP